LNVFRTKRSIYLFDSSRREGHQISLQRPKSCLATYQPYSKVINAIWHVRLSETRSSIGVICLLSMVNLSLALIPHPNNGHASPNVETTGSVIAVFSIPLSTSRSTTTVYTSESVTILSRSASVTKRDSSLTSVALPLWTQRRDSCLNRARLLPPRQSRPT